MEKLKEHPYTSTNCWSRLFFWWLIPTFRKGLKNTLTFHDLFQNIEEDESALLGSKIETLWANECQMVKLGKRRNGRPKLYNVLVKMFFKKFLFAGILIMVNEWLVRIAQLVFLQKLLSSLQHDKDKSEKDGDISQYLCGTGFIMTTFTHTMVAQPIAFQMSHIGMKCRVAISALIYNKTLKLKNCRDDKEAKVVGQVVNLLSNDVNRFDTHLATIPYILIGPIQLGLFVYLLWAQAHLNFASLVAPLFFLFILSLQFQMGKLFTGIVFKIGRQSDCRSHILHEILSGISVIKMFAWEQSFTTLLTNVRWREVKILKHLQTLRGIWKGVHCCSTKLITGLTIVITLLVVGNGEMRASEIFLMVAIYNTMHETISNYIPVAITHIGALHAATSRLEDFLLLNERPPNKTVQKSSPAISMVNASACWSTDGNILKNLAVNLSGDKLVMIIGPVGSGKSSLLQLLLSEMTLTEGQCEIKGRLSYGSQEPWIFSGQLKENILVDPNSQNNEVYNLIVEACALKNDFAKWPHGDKTLVGERGICLSGGQKSRVNLARALAKNGANIFLLDDPLSAVDLRVAQHIFERAIQTFLRGKLRILVTHQLQYVSQADHIIILNNGSIVAQGSYKQLKNQGIDFGLYARPCETIETRLEKLKEPKESGGECKLTTEPEMAVEKVVNGSIGWGTYKEYFLFVGSKTALIFSLSTFIFLQIFISFADYWLAYWIRRSDNKITNCDQLNGGNLNSNWSHSSSHQNCVPFDNLPYLQTYTVLIGVISGSIFVNSIYFYQMSPKISHNLHDRLIKSIMAAPIKFFEENQSGRILNRCTNDLNSLDQELFPAFFNVLQVSILMVASVVIVTLTNSILIVPSVILLIVLFFIRKFYIITSRQIKRMEATARSQKLTHVVATLEGLSTIRGLNMEDSLTCQFHEYQNRHSATWFMMISADRFMPICIDLTTVFYMGIITYSFLLWGEWGFARSESSHVGLAISTALKITISFSAGVRHSAFMENMMICVERLLEYCKIPSEVASTLKMRKPSREWPSKGAIQFQNVYFAYNDMSQNVSNGLTFKIAAKEKIGIVGRTGAGKTSIASLLLRLREPQSGDILIDDVSIGNVDLASLRTKISIIPQDPVLFSESIRYNLDPFNEFQDEELWRVIQQVRLKDTVPNLEVKVTGGGGNFSMGERQLLCLARVILRKNKILILDEATANVDPQTDELIQKTIRQLFRECTVITIAHRLNTVLDSDRILVMENGSVQEFDTPQKLLENPESLFRAMMQGLEHTRPIKKMIGMN